VTYNLILYTNYGINSFIFSGDVFEDWDLAEKYIEKYATDTGFEVVKRRLGKNQYGKIISRTFECKHSRDYQPKIKAGTEENRVRESVKTNCPWRVNLYLSKDIVRITSLCNEHNHRLVENIRNIAPKFLRLSPDMLNEIEYLVSIGCNAGSIICGLQKRFPDVTICPKNVYNAICTFQHSQKLVKTDAAETYEKLMQLQREEGWFVESRLEGEDNHLTGLFWMRPSQIDLWQKFHDIAINDNTAHTNKYHMHLSLTIIIDNHSRSQIAAIALISDETKESY
jgi:hypothetical protein